MHRLVMVLKLNLKRFSMKATAATKSFLAMIRWIKSLKSLKMKDLMRVLTHSETL